MKIATWNIARYPKRFQIEILKEIEIFDADILVLTETNNSIELEHYQCHKTKALATNVDGQTYRTGENRTSIYSKYPIISIYETYNCYTSVCADLQTPIGILTVYASIIGIVGNLQPYFNNDLTGQTNDYNAIFPNKENICVIGDLNTTFTGRVFPSHHARNALNTAFENFNLVNITKDIDNNVDHIVLSKHLVSAVVKTPIIWNKEKKISDHIGIRIEI